MNDDVEIIKRNILLLLKKLKNIQSPNQSEPNLDPFLPGPVGDSPIHGCFLLGLHDLGFELIDEFYSTPGLLSTPYRNDLKADKFCGTEETAQVSPKSTGAC